MNPNNRTDILPRSLELAEDVIETLAGRSWRLSAVVSAISSQKRVALMRARILVLLIESRCPVGVKPRRRWYVPGGVARLGIDGLRRRWFSRFGVDPPTRRTFQAHIAELERACALVRVPGDWIPCKFDPGRPERRPRYVDTFLLLEEELEAEWWSTEGRRLEEARPDTRCSPAAWRMVFHGWRERAIRGEHLQPTLFEVGGIQAAGIPVPKRTAPAPSLEDPGYAADQIAEIVHRESASPGEIIGTLDRLGIQIVGVNRSRLQRDIFRLRGGLALLALALRRGDTIRKPSGWIVRATGASDRELKLALRSLPDPLEIAPRNHRPNRASEPMDVSQLIQTSLLR